MPQRQKPPLKQRLPQRQKLPLKQRPPLKQKPPQKLKLPLKLKPPQRQKLLLMQKLLLKPLSVQAHLRLLHSAIQRLTAQMPVPRTVTAVTAVTAATIAIVVIDSTDRTDLTAARPVREATATVRVRIIRDATTDSAIAIRVISFRALPVRSSRFSPLSEVRLPRAVRNSRSLAEQPV